MIRDGVSIHGYVAKPEPRTPAHFNSVVADSFRQDQTFMNAVVVERFTPTGGSTRIHNLKLIETPPSGPAATTVLADHNDLIDAIEHRLGVPRDITRYAIGGVDLCADIYS
jgi:hypothetical protein